MKDLLYLFNNGHEPFGRGGLGYKPTHKVVLQHPGFVIRGGGRSRTQTAYSTPTQVVYKSPIQIEKEEFTITPDEEEEVDVDVEEEEEVKEEKEEKPRPMSTTKKAPTISERFKEVKERVSKITLEPIPSKRGRPKTLGALIKAKEDAIKEAEKKAKEAKETVNFQHPKNLIKQLKEVNQEIKKDESRPDIVFDGEYSEELIPIIKSIERVRGKFFKSDEIDKDFTEEKDLRISLYTKLPSETFKKEKITREQKAILTKVQQKERKEAFKKHLETKKGFASYYNNPYFQNALPYIETIIGENDKYKFWNKEEFDDIKAMMAFFKPGKPFEFGICGPGNQLAKKIFGLSNPNFQITDYLIESFGSSLGSQFPIDNIDLDNLIFNEMKYYTDITYKNVIELQTRLKKVHYYDLLKDLKDLLKDYRIASLTENIEELTKISTDINTLKVVLTNKDEFNKDFYKYSRAGYIGIGVTMNKFNPIKIPSGFDFSNCPSSEQQILEVQKNQGQKFIPNLKNRKLKGFIAKESKEKKMQKINDEFNEKIKKNVFSGGREYSYTITCGMRDTIGVYDYTKDDYVENDFILNTYRTAYAHDEQGDNYNAVLIPIEKFIPPKLSKQKKRSVEI